MKSIRTLFTTRLWLLFGLVPMAQGIYGFLWFLSPSLFSESATLGVNKTVGWAWDIWNSEPFFALGFSIVFFIGYGFLSLFKIPTLWWLSVLQFASFMPMLLTWRADITTFVAAVTTLMVFPINVVASIVFRSKKNRCGFTDDSVAKRHP